MFIRFKILFSLLIVLIFTLSVTGNAYSSLTNIVGTDPGLDSLRPSPTPTPIPQPCRSIDMGDERYCGGDCPEDQQCLYLPGEGCICTDRACIDINNPAQCSEGGCPRDGDFCGEESGGCICMSGTEDIPVQPPIEPTPQVEPSAPEIPLTLCNNTSDCPAPPFGCGACTGGHPTNSDQSICVSCHNLTGNELQNCVFNAIRQVEVELGFIFRDLWGMPEGPQRDAMRDLIRQLNLDRIELLEERLRTLVDCGQVHYAQLEHEEGFLEIFEEDLQDLL